MKENDSMDVMQALREHGEAGAAIVDLLYGDGAYEVSKALTAEQEKSQRLQARVGLASNVVGLTAGTAAIGSEVRNVRNARRKAAGQPEMPEKDPMVSRMGEKMSGSKRFKPLRKIGGAIGRNKGKVVVGTAAAGLGLQGLNVAGDVVANRVLSRAANDGVKKSADDDIEWFGEFSKMDSDKRQVFGWASVTSVNGVPVKDLQSDEIDLEEIEKAAYDYVKTSRKGGNMHERDGEVAKHVSDMIESLVVTPEKAQALGINGGNEGWWVGFQVNDDATWQDAKDGKLVGFSIHGKGRRAS